MHRSRRFGVTADRTSPDAGSPPAPEIRIEDLPEWMRPRPRRLDWGFFIVFAGIIPLLWPLLTQPGLSAQNNASTYIARSIQVASLMRSGTLYARWAPDFYNGLGSPLFNYLAPLPHYLAGFHELITDARATDSIRLLIGSALLLAGLGMYQLVRLHSGRASAILAAFLYATSGLLSDRLPYVQGDVAALLSLGLLPLAAWALDWIGGIDDGRSLILPAVAIALWALADARMTCIGLISLSGVLLLGWVFGGPNRRMALARRMWVLLIALLLTAFFWVPALAERDSVVWVATERIPGQAASAQPARNSANTSWFQAVDSDTLLDGLAPFLGAVIGAWAWDHVVRAGRRVRRRSAYRRQLVTTVERIALGALCGVILLRAVAAILSLPAPAAYAPDTQDEQQLGVYGTLRDGVLLPVTAASLNDPKPVFAFERVRKSSGGDVFPLTMGVSLVVRDALASRYTVNLSNTELMRFDRYAFPGWTIAIDGVNYEPQSDPSGIAAFSIPAAAHEAVLWFGTTPIRTLSWAATLGGFGLIFIPLRARRRGSRRAPPKVAPTAP